jgi:hypothetical protein
MKRNASLTLNPGIEEDALLSPAHPRIEKQAIPTLTLDGDDGIIIQLNMGRDAFLTLALACGGMQRCTWSRNSARLSLR